MSKENIREAIIGLIKDRPALWDTSISAYSNKNIVSNDWEDVVKSLIEMFSKEELKAAKANSVSAIKKLWQSLRCSFRNAKKRGKGKTGDGRDDVIPPKTSFPFYDAMLFLEAKAVHVSNHDSMAFVETQVVNQSPDLEVIINDGQQQQQQQQQQPEEEEIEFVVPPVDLSNENESNDDADDNVTEQSSQKSPIPSTSTGITGGSVILGMGTNAESGTSTTAAAAVSVVSGMGGSSGIRSQVESGLSARSNRTRPNFGRGTKRRSEPQVSNSEILTAQLLEAVREGDNTLDSQFGKYLAVFMSDVPEDKKRDLHMHLLNEVIEFKRNMN